MTTNWQCLRFEELAATAVYAMLKLRAEVFVVEQRCAYLDPDGLDAIAFHWLGWQADQLVAYQRCMAPGTPYADESAIGRIVVNPRCRGQAMGRQLVEKGIVFNRSQWPAHPIRISAQSQLLRFYEHLGFISCDDHYLEDGIEHVHMLLPAP